MTAQLALVTGASSGIGLELAKLFARDGFDLVVAADDDGIFDVAAQLRADGVDVQPVRVDLRQSDEVERLYRTATEDSRPLDAAALNAATGDSGRFVDTDPSRDMNVIDLNVRSTVQLAKLTLRDMAARGVGKCCSPRRWLRRCRGRIRRCTTRRSRSSSRSPRRCTTSSAIPV